MDHPEQRLVDEVRTGRWIYQPRLRFEDGKMYLLRVVVSEEEQPPAILTAYRINMTKIESRPSKRKAWEYFFFVDCEGHMEDRRVAKAISLLSEHCSYVKVLGSYPDTD